MFKGGTDRQRPHVIAIPRQRETDENVDEIDVNHMEQERLELLRKAEQSRLKARDRAWLVKQVWVHGELATRDKQRVADARNPEVVDAYGGSRAAADPFYKKYASENTWYMTRSQTMAINLICEQNKVIIRLLSKIAGES